MNFHISLDLAAVVSCADLSPLVLRSRPSDQHASGHLCPAEAAGHHPLPSGRQPACDVSEVGERRLPSQGREGQSASWPHRAEFPHFLVSSFREKKFTHFFNP